jgi:hypothetical protein
MAVETISHPPSRNIAWITYDAEQQLMTIGFQKGAVYQYFEVPGDVAYGFGQAMDANDYLRTFVTNSFVYDRIG